MNKAILFGLLLLVLSLGGCVVGCITLASELGSSLSGEQSGDNATTISGLSVLGLLAAVVFIAIGLIMKIFEKKD